MRGEASAGDESIERCRIIGKLIQAERCSGGLGTLEFMEFPEEHSHRLLYFSNTYQPRGVKMVKAVLKAPRVIFLERALGAPYW